MKSLLKVIVVAGPTASGKSDFAVNLALKNNGEIISADSRQIYRGLDIGTGKITKSEMKGIPHYMLDICDLVDDFSVSEYKRLALPILEDIISRGKTPIICGGTGQYIDTLIFDTTLPRIPPNKKLREQFEKKNTDKLYREILKKDPRRAKAIDKNNRRRLIRALEIISAIGKVPIQDKPKLLYPTTIYIMSPTRKTLRERITKRLESRLNVGMVDEVKKIIKYIGPTYVDMKKFGLEYVAISKFLEKKITKEEMKQEIITKSMQYAKRQDTWNKRYKTVFPSSLGQNVKDYFSTLLLTSRNKKYPQKYPKTTTLVPVE